MPDLDIRQGDLEKFSTELRELSANIATYTTLPLNLSQVQSAMPGGSAYKQAQYAGEHMEDQLTALKTSLEGLADNVQAAATEFQATEDINQQSLQQIMASTPKPCPPVGPAKGE